MALSAAALPTLYEYYTGGNGNISSGLSVDQPQFTLNGKEIFLYSGAMHYFRIPKQHWRDRLKKLRAAGLNTVETYVPWNLHEPANGTYDFGNGPSDMTDFLDVQEYLKIAKEEDLFAIVRPGPYICAEWEWGGFPSWLMKEEGLQVRTSESKYMSYVRRYFSVLLPLLAMLQFTNGGPIIAFQVENEYGYWSPKDYDYIEGIIDLMKDNGIVELLVSSDGAGSGDSGSVPELFKTVNLGGDPENSFSSLLSMQPDKPVMVMEYYPGWFDHWSEEHHTKSNDDLRDVYERILKYPASVNFYMFHGGTNFGFMNGANIDGGDNHAFQPTTTSYDYDAPITEAGDYTEKYQIIQELIKKYSIVELLTPDPPELTSRTAYPAVEITSQMNFSDVLSIVGERVLSTSLLSMEDIDQSYGYLVYHKNNLDIAANSVLTIGGHICDAAMVLINGVLISKPLLSSSDLDGFGYWRVENSSITLTSEDLSSATLDIVIENWGRANIGEITTQHKGLNEDRNKVYINNDEVNNWVMVPLPFTREWTESLNLDDFKQEDLQSGPGLYYGETEILDPTDTFVDMEAWTKGIVIVNGFVLGRYASIGPQQMLYLPGQFLKNGTNSFIIFEQFQPANEIKFVTEPVFNTKP